MDPSSSPDQIIIKEIPGLIRLYKTGRYQKLAGEDPLSGVQSKDVVISPSESTYPKPKLPLVIFFHGGAFIIDTAASPIYHTFSNLISSESNAVVVSVDYRTAPDHPVPACFDDSWEAIKWVGLHAAGNGLDPWLNEYPDFGNVVLAGDSAGANIAHHLAIRVGSENPTGSLININFKGIIMLHPYFWGKDRVGSESDEHPWIATVNDIWMFVHPGTSGLDDPLIDPGKDPKLSDLGCSRVLVCVAENDFLRNRGLYYMDILVKSGWEGDIEVVDDEGVGHVYFLYSPYAESACNLRRKICTFINH